MMLVVGLAGFILVGLALGLLGGGGSILAVPVLVYIFDLPASVAVPMSLPVVGITAAFGAWRKHLDGQLHLRRAVTFGAVAMITSFSAARFGREIPDQTRLLIFTAVLLLAAAIMWRRSLQSPIAAGAGPMATGTFSVTLVVAALTVGALTGLVGVGGGFLIVPALVGVLGMPMAEATAKSLAVIAMNAAAATFGWWGHVELDLGVMAMVVMAALVGMLLGIRWAPRFSARTLTRAFAALLVVVAMIMLGDQVIH